MRILDRSFAASSVFVDRRDVGGERALLTALFVAGLDRTTTALWIAFFCLLPVHVFYGWAPTLLTGKGFDVQTASFGLALFNFAEPERERTGFTIWVSARAGPRFRT